MDDVHHESVFFTGRVQGVGFRYTTQQVAKEYDVTGYVTNLPDGRVQLETEGKTEEVEAFVQALSDRMHSYIKKIERKSARRPAQFKGFLIR